MAIDRKKILEDIKDQQCGSQELAQRMLIAEPEELKKIVQDYVAYKFMLELQDFEQTDNIIKLADISVKNAVKHKNVRWDQRDCHGATESMNKKVLMVSALERSLGFRFSNDEYMNINTVSDLAAAVLRNREE
ncbi:MAG: hypothetical protein LUE11_10850 [Clostridia bacterium]|nr:hypothetical protein [Clostridia bacterium]